MADPDELRAARRDRRRQSVRAPRRARRRRRVRSCSWPARRASFVTGQTFQRGRRPPVPLTTSVSAQGDEGVEDTAVTWHPEVGERHREERERPWRPYLAIGRVDRRPRHRLARSTSRRTSTSSRTRSMPPCGIICINMPVKLIALAEGALTGFTDEAFDVPHVIAARELFIDIPGEESDRSRAGAQVRDLPGRPVQGALARGHAQPVLQHALRHFPAGRDRAQGREEPSLVPRALVHATRRLRPLGRALRRRHRRLLSGPSDRRHRQPGRRSAAPTANIPRPSGPWRSTAPRSSIGRARPCR